MCYPGPTVAHSTTFAATENLYRDRAGKAEPETASASRSAAQSAIAANVTVLASTAHTATARRLASW